MFLCKTDQIPHELYNIIMPQPVYYSIAGIQSKHLVRETTMLYPNKNV